ncbi:MAG TPA: exosortase family protein XrtF [Cyclobacteriaceae bacterium]
MLKEFKPSILFLSKFLGVYLAGNIVYGLWITSFDQRADSMTSVVTLQTSSVLNAFGEDTKAIDSDYGPTVWLKRGNKIILNVFEGCNGINVMIVFVAFIVAFGGKTKAILWFVPLGLITIHLFNIIRIALLYVVAQHYQSYFYYVHKYIFTGILYLIVFALWILGVMKVNDVRERSKG